MGTKFALITGINGQDGSYLAELLLDKDYIVFGIIRRASLINTFRIDHLSGNPRLHLHYGDMTDTTCLISILTQIKNYNIIHNKPPLERLEVYNLAAMSHVKVSFEIPEYTADVDAMGALRLLEAIRATGLGKVTRFYQASTSEMYGKVQEVPQDENTPFYPRSPYGCAKLYAHWITKNYREAYNMFACSGILFNHESERRGKTFVTRKITIGINKILKGEEDCLVLGNLDAKRDWGHAKDFVKGMWMMLQRPEPDDYVLATGEMHSVREFVECAFGQKGVKIGWRGKGLKEEGYDLNSQDKKALVKVSERYFRPSEVEQLLGNADKAKLRLGWKPEITFHELVKRMVDHDT